MIKRLPRFVTKDNAKKGEMGKPFVLRIGPKAQVDSS